MNLNQVLSLRMFFCKVFLKNFLIQAWMTCTVFYKVVPKRFLMLVVLI